MDLNEIKNNSKLYTQNNVRAYLDDTGYIYNKLIDEAYKQITKQYSVGLVVGILNSGKIPAIDLANKFGVEVKFVEYHKTLTGKGDFTFPTIKTSKGTYPLKELGGIANGENAYYYNKAIKLESKLENKLISNNLNVLIVDDSTCSGHNSVLPKHLQFQGF